MSFIADTFNREPNKQGETVAQKLIALYGPNGERWITEDYESKYDNGGAYCLIGGYLHVTRGLEGVAMVQFTQQHHIGDGTSDQDRDMRGKIVPEALCGEPNALDKFNAIAPEPALLALVEAVEFFGGTNGVIDYNDYFQEVDVADGEEARAILYRDRILPVLQEMHKLELGKGK